MGIMFKGMRKIVSSSPHHLIPRKVKFDWRATPIDWLRDEPFASHFMNAVHLIFPAGELWMCRMVNKAIPYIMIQNYWKTHAHLSVRKPCTLARIALRWMSI